MICKPSFLTIPSYVLTHKKWVKIFEELEDCKDKAGKKLTIEWSAEEENSLQELRKFLYE